jgi:hypothetical protein
MSYEGLEINLMFRNVEGAYFEDVTASSGTGHLLKGRGVAFADWDCDGDLDPFVELGGATPGDLAYNALFQNPIGQIRRIRLIGLFGHGGRTAEYLWRARSAGSDACAVLAQARSARISHRQERIFWPFAPFPIGSEGRLDLAPGWSERALRGGACRGHAPKPGGSAHRTLRVERALM